MNIKRIFVIFLLFIFSLVSAADKERDKNIYYNKEHELKMIVPEGWIVIDKSNPEQLKKELNGNTMGIISIFKKSSPDSPVLISIQSNILLQNYTIEDYAETLKNIPALEIIENSHVTTLGSNKCSKTITKLRDPAGDKIYVYYHFLNGKISYSIGCYLSVNEFDTYKDILENIATSVQFEGIKIDPFVLADAEQLDMLAGKYFSSGQFDKAIEYYEKALDKTNDTDLEIKILTMISSSYLEKGITKYVTNKDDRDYRKAIDYAEQALKIKQNYWAALGNIAVVYMNMDQLEKADFYYSEAEKYIEKNSPEYQQLTLSHALVKKALEARKKKQ